MTPYTSSTWIQYTNSELAPRTSSGLQARRGQGRRAQAQAHATAIVSTPARRHRKVGDVVQK